jgi:hypothetical protein
MLDLAGRESTAVAIVSGAASHTLGQTILAPAEICTLPGHHLWQAASVAVTVDFGKNIFRIIAAVAAAAAGSGSPPLLAGADSFKYHLGVGVLIYVGEVRGINGYHENINVTENSATVPVVAVVVSQTKLLAGTDALEIEALLPVVVLLTTADDTALVPVAARLPSYRTL